MIGVFGGTFDPPHLGHLILASFALDGLGLKEVWWVLTPRSPLKPEAPISPVEGRERMVLAAIESEPRFRLSRADLDRPAPHYAADTLERLADEDPAAAFVFLLGSDSLEDLPRWRDPTRLLGHCAALGVMRRPGAAPDLDRLERAVPGVSAKVRYFEAPLVAISGREIRARVAAGERVRYLVPDSVLAIVRAEALYAKAPSD
jgi:nicotinate-nucleotide adenylyltransferase